MKKYSSRILVLSVLVISLIALPGIIQAQPDTTVDTTDPDAPIDGGLSLLLAVGIGYGIKKNRDNRKKKTTHFL